MDLYRYISFEEFMSIVTLNRMHYVQPLQWADTYEGYIYQVLKDDHYKQLLISKLYDKLQEGTPAEKASTVLSNYCGILYATTNWYGQCWTKDSAESDSFWRIYSHGNKAVRIHTTSEKLSSLFDANAYHMAQKAVVYDNATKTEDLVDLQIDALYNSEKTTEGFFHKRAAFSHEKEYRVLISPKTLSNGEPYDYNYFLQFTDLMAHINMFKDAPHSNKEECLAAVMDRIENALPPVPKREPSIYVPIPSVPNLITDVLVTPLAADWYVDLVKGVCDQNGITFAGKSHLYDAVL